MAFTQTDLDRLDSAIAMGMLTCKLNGKEVTYRSMDELMKARNFIANQLAQQSGISTGSAIYTEFSRG